MGSIPARGTKIPHAAWHGQKIKIKSQKNSKKKKKCPPESFPLPERGVLKERRGGNNLLTCPCVTSSLGTPFPAPRRLPVEPGNPADLN